MNNDLEVETRPEIVGFVESVRARLAYLEPEVREELTDGLEADLSELVADHGGDRPLGEVLGDPASYADELCAAAGLERSRPTRRGLHGRGVGLWARSAAAVEAGGRRIEREVSTRPWVQALVAFLVALRPAWWVLRAWLAVQLVDRWSGPDETFEVIPRLGLALVGPIVLLAAVVGSVQLGRGAWWPATRQGTSRVARGALVAANAFALLVALPLVLDGTDNVAYTSSGGGGRVPGLVNDGHYVSNIYAFDSDGTSVTGVQLFDQAGRPLSVDPQWAGGYRIPGEPGRMAPYPWFNGTARLYNVYPLPVRAQSYVAYRASAWDSDRPPVLPPALFASVPGVTLPGAALPEPPEPTTEPVPQNQPTDGRSPRQR
ncbi:hypothetical protein [Nocardioides sp.]|uniref:hypothetical protein n=1 Tax=Nocardioides sp. TaxID=35761 RepID=UPI003D0C6CDC